MIHLPFCSQRTVTLALSGSPVKYRLTLGRKATPILHHFSAWMGAPTSSYLSGCTSVCVGQHCVPGLTQTKSPWQTEACWRLSLFLTLLCTTAQGQRDMAQKVVEKKYLISLFPALLTRLTWLVGFILCLSPKMQRNWIYSTERVICWLMKVQCDGILS